jgi:hypothetical protein
MASFDTGLLVASHFFLAFPTDGGNFPCGRTHAQRVNDSVPGRRAWKITEMNVAHYALT